MEFIAMSSILILIILFIFLFRNKLNYEPKTVKVKNYKFDSDFNEYEKNLLIKIFEEFGKYKFYNVPRDIFFSVLWQESGGEIYKNKLNSEIIGDDGNSIGYMQVNKYGALKEFNNKTKKNYTFKDLEDTYINLQVGNFYLNEAIKLAKEKCKNKPLQWLVFKMYNGGLDETESSNNKKANNYANECYKKFLKVNKFLRLNNLI